MVFIKSTPLELTRRKNRPPSLFTYTYTYTYTPQVIPSSLSFTQAIETAEMVRPQPWDKNHLSRWPLLHVALILPDIRRYQQQCGTLPNRLKHITGWPLPPFGRIDSQNFSAQAREPLPEGVTSPMPCSGEPLYYVQCQQTICAPPLTMATKLVQRYQEGARNISHSKSGSEGYSSLTDNEEWQPYAIYEKDGEFSVGIGLAALITAYPNYVHIRYQQQNDHGDSFSGEQFQERVWLSSDIVGNISSALASIPIKEWRAYGLSQLELVHLFHNPASHAAPGTALLQIFLPLHEYRLNRGSAIIRSLLPSHLPQLLTMLQQCDSDQYDNAPSINKSSIYKSSSCEPSIYEPSIYEPSIYEQPGDEYDENNQRAHKQDSHLQTQVERSAIEMQIRQTDPTIFCDRVAKTVNEIRQGKYQKAILSRQIPLPNNINLLASYQRGRINNTSARSYAFRMQGFELMGFSSKTAVTVSANGCLITQLLTDTHVLSSDQTQSVPLHHELRINTEDITEHTSSILSVVATLTPICVPGSVAIVPYMKVLTCGKVQNLASCLQGQLQKGISHWQAMQSLYPVAADIPKDHLMQATLHELGSWEAYSSSVLMVDSNGALDATLISESLSRKNKRFGLRAGTEITHQADPLLKLEETHETLIAIARYLVLQTAMTD
ncbi:chorismate binding enzyme family protein [Yersinia pseudotuberculosis]|nr:chorismate binding enzyme family protein [Yersinia pseudotuberculosis]AJJ66094.1 chorismate binding enzyme family protein [Yersinia pseudotuberculosis PB1/+]CQD48705.1 chorismate-binding domain-containing protein [Yersinia intermedia]AJJ69849.1 chorismate binding enzyme family protein [Yersinia pseudotuberculosis]PSH11402.1 chorismate-binding protein [Yersinia pseudotuberculosis]